MVRHKEYDRHEVIENAVGLFWQKGYKATSVTDIVQATGLNTASMYKEFGDKDGLFEEALEHYRQNIVSHRIQMLIDEPNIRGVEKYIESVVNGAASEEYRGCLMLNHLAQKHSISRQAVEKISDFCAKTESLLEVAFRNAQSNGEISTGRDPAVLASFVMCLIHGLVLYGRHPGKNDEIPKLFDVIMGALGE